MYNIAKLISFLVVPVVITPVVIAAACGTAPDDASTPPAVRQPPDRPDREPLIESETTSDGLKAILGTGDLGVGTNRVGFVLTSQTGFVTTPGVRVTPRYASDGAVDVKETVAAEFQEWPYGNRGLYTAYIDLERAGQWEFEISVPGGEGEAAMVVPLSVEVSDAAYSPMEGDPAVASKTRTLNEVESIEEVTTGSLQDPDLYQISLDQAIASGKPTVVVFASPAFCQNAVCGPQVDILQEIKDAYKDDANFVHVDFYDNPHEIQGDLDRAVISPAVREWRLPSIEWTFVIDRGGIVTARFEGFATYDEVQAALQQVL